MPLSFRYQIPDGGNKFSASPSTSSKNLHVGSSTLNNGKLGSGVKWTSSEEVSASPPKSASYFTNRRRSLPANTLSLKTRTCLNDIFSNTTGSSAEETTVKTLNLTKESAKKGSTPAFRRLKSTATLTQNCRHLAELMKARSEAISRLSYREEESSETNCEDIDDESPRDDDGDDSNTQLQISPRPPSQTLPPERRGRLASRRGSTPVLTRSQLLTTQQEKRSYSLSPNRSQQERSPQKPQESASDKSSSSGGFSLGNLLAAPKSPRDNASSPNETKRDIFINSQRRDSIRKIDPMILLIAQKQANMDNVDNVPTEEVPKHLKKVIWNMNSPLTKSTVDFGVSGGSGRSGTSSGDSKTVCRRSATPGPGTTSSDSKTMSRRSATPGPGTTSSDSKTMSRRSATPGPGTTPGDSKTVCRIRSATPAPGVIWCRRTDSEIAEQVEAELQSRVADRRRQLKNMMKFGRRLNAIQMIGPRAHQSTKMLEHLPGSRLRKVLDEVDFNRTTNELIEVRVETLKVSLSL